MSSSKIIAVLNAGSSTLKCALFEANSSSTTPLWKGLIEKTSQKAYEKEAQSFLKSISYQFPDISAVGHRIVHGGERFIEPTLLTPSSLKALEKLSFLAPLHNPANLEGVQWAKHLWPDVPHVGVFDTAFHHTLPKQNFVYPIPLKWLKQGIRRYGFHGISHESCYQTLLQFDPKIAHKKVITCHLGNGCSLAAIKEGKCLDTTMGFTPMEGLVMGTRSGSIDPGIIFHLLRLGETPKELEEMLNRKSGLEALAGTHDMRKVKKNTLAFDVFCQSVVKYIASLVGSLGGVDLIAFTGGIGENAGDVRASVCKQLAFLGIQISPKSSREGKISTSKSRIGVYVIQAREEWWIAEKTKELLLPTNRN